MSTRIVAWGTGGGRESGRASADGEDLGPVIDRVAKRVGRRMGLASSEVEDLASETRLKILSSKESGREGYRGEGSFETYLTVVVSRLAIDERTKRFGRWRPSRKAMEAGPDAVELERAVSLGGLEPHAALAHTQSRFPCSSERRLEEFLESLPFRRSRTFVPLDALSEATAAGDPEALALGDEDRRLAQQAVQALGELVAALPPEDRVVLRLRFDEDMKVSEIGRSLGMDARSLYRRIPELLSRLKKELIARGITERLVTSILRSDEGRIGESVEPF